MSQSLTPTSGSTAASPPSGATTSVAVGLTWVGALQVCNNGFKQIMALNSTAAAPSGRLQAFKLTSLYGPGTVGESFNFVSQIIHLAIGNGGSGRLTHLCTHPSYAAAFAQPVTDRPALRLAARGELVMWRMTVSQALAARSMPEFGNLCGGLVGSCFGTDWRMSFMESFSSWKNYAPKLTSPASIAKAGPAGAIMMAAIVTQSQWSKISSASASVEKVD